eukprot:TRINITY_DN16837_c0_g1_i1.p1 TRINITY_DN16837_c0_g1~~TRINITY_DN16837_c0_g1_i1.p1  ORF type:complete len:205 (+),score=28.85 TRINITY_DN16837_c0_g1_i1:49-615(+)
MCIRDRLMNLLNQNQRLTNKNTTVRTSNNSTGNVDYLSTRYETPTNNSHEGASSWNDLTSDKTLSPMKTFNDLNRRKRVAGSAKQSIRQTYWTQEEDEILLRYVGDSKHQGCDWRKVSDAVQGKSELDCLERWQKLMNPPDSFKGKKKPWTEEEDLLVLKLVERNGPQKWSLIADHLPGRIGKQCRER